MSLQDRFDALKNRLSFTEWERGREVEILTDRLRLREWREEDAAQAHLFRSDPEVRRYDVHPPSTLIVTQAWMKQAVRIRRLKPRRNFELAVVLQSNERVIGEIGLWMTAWGRRASMGFMLAQSEWNRGYMTEAVTALLEFGFRELDLSRIIAQCHPENAGSWRVMEKTGFIRSDRIPIIRFQDGQKIPSFEYRIDQQQWIEQTSSSGRWSPHLDRIDAPYQEGE